MNNNVIIDRFRKKAGFIVCLFLVYSLPCPGQDWRFSSSSLRAYSAALRLDFDSTAQLRVDSPDELYVSSFQETLKILLNEDRGELENYESHTERLLDQNDEELTAANAFVEAEIQLHRAFVYLKFREDTRAAFNLRRCFKTTSAAIGKYPDFIPLKKTSGLLNVMIGSVPEKYRWITSLMGMNGSIEKGLTDLQRCSESASTVATEASLLKALCYAFILQQPEDGLAAVDSLINTDQGNHLYLFLGGSLAIKSSNSKKALDFFSSTRKENKVVYMSYLYGESLLHKGDYPESIKKYQQFLVRYKGNNYVKDAHFKIGICYLLLGDHSNADANFTKAKALGAAETEADKYAARALGEIERLNPKLLKVRYYTDGGYFAEAEKVLEDITPKELPDPKSRAEYYYRKARLKHKEHELAAAELFYIQTIEMCGTEPWYFAPNSCLQLGYILQEKGQNQKAGEYFKKALTYKDHAYKNSIDSKAKSALNQMANDIK